MTIFYIYYSTLNVYKFCVLKRTLTVRDYFLSNFHLSKQTYSFSSSIGSIILYYYVVLYLFCIIAGWLPPIKSGLALGSKDRRLVKWEIWSWSSMGLVRPWVTFEVHLHTQLSITHKGSRTMFDTECRCFKLFVVIHTPTTWYSVAVGMLGYFFIVGYA